MENLVNEQTEVLESQPATAETEKGEKQTEVSLGKFKDAKSLLEAYNSLQSEFTKRCQRIKELENLNAVADKTVVPAETKPKEINKEEILKDYLKELMGAKSQAVILDGQGSGIKTPLNRPKTIEEAGKLATELLAK